MKTIEELYQEMLACYREQTGLEPGVGCDLAVRFYALAAQVYALQVQSEWVARQAFPQTAEGEYLDRHAQMRGLTRKEATHARGVVRFTAGAAAGEDRVIPAGTVCMTAGLVRFETVADAVLPAGELWVDAAVQAVVPGVGGNVAARTIREMAVAPTGVASCTNPAPCAGGGAREEDEELRARVLDTYLRLPNGANAAYYQQEALAFDRVAAACVLPRPRGIGTVDVVVATPEGLPDEALLAQLTGHFQREREIAVDVQVRAPRIKSVDVTVRVTPADGLTFETAAAGVERVLRERFTGKGLGRGVLRAELADLIYNCGGVANYELAEPAADVSAEGDELPLLGRLKVEAMA